MSLPHDPTRDLLHGVYDAVVAVVHENERPLQGLAAWIDWRLEGRISQFVRSGAISGKSGELIFIADRHHDRILKILMIGNGKCQEPGARSTLSETALDKLTRNIRMLGIQRIGVSTSDLGNASQKKFESLVPGVNVCWID